MPGLLALGALATPSSSRADFVIEYFTPAFNGGTPSGGDTVPNPFLRATFHSTAANTVQLTIDVLFGSSLPEYIDSIRFNTTVTPLAFNHVSGVTASSTNTGSFGSSGGYGPIPGNFDINIEFPNSAANRLNGAHPQTVYNITGTGLTEASFNSLSTGGTTPMVSAVHMAGFGTGSSGAFRGRAVPEPGSLALVAMGSGAMGLLALRRRKAMTPA
jgi:hypothetical protein